MIKKHYYSWQDVERMCTNIVLQMYKDNYKPDYIVGITRGGNIPATIISQMLDVRCEALKVKLRDGKEGEECESNLWMAEDAFGYHRTDDLPGTSNPHLRKNILIIDDINDTGATFNWIKQDWQSGCLPLDDEWNNIWGYNVRFAVLTDNLSSEFDQCVNYCADTVNKAEQDVWLVYPWENVGEY